MIFDNLLHIVTAEGRFTVVGFIKGLFGNQNAQKQDSQKQAEESATQSSTPAPRQSPPRQAAPRQKEVAFFLDADDASTLGNVEYMRSIKSVRRTFPKTLSNPEEKEVIVEVSSMTTQQAKKVAEQVAKQIAADPQSSEQAVKVTVKINEPVESRPADSNLDMFRKMAKEIRKR